MRISRIDGSGRGLYWQDWRDSLAKFFVVTFFAVLGIAFVYYVPLLNQSEVRKPAIDFFWWVLLPAAALHAAILALLLLLPRRYSLPLSIGYWIVSIAALAAAGSWIIVAPMLAIVPAAVIMALIGRIPAHYLLPAEMRNVWVSLGLGIVLFAVAGSFLALFHLFTAWAFVVSIGALLYWAFRKKHIDLTAGWRTSWADLSSKWNPSMAVALEGLALIAAFILVQCATPETGSDTAQRYWPYIRLLKHARGFFEIPYQWWFIIPYAGLAYAGGIYVLGQHAARWAMFLPWIAAVGLVARGLGTSPGRALPEREQNAGSRSWTSPTDSWGAGLTMALLVASMPVILDLSSTVMQDTFAILVVLIVAVVCLRGFSPDGIAFLPAVGVLIAVGLTAKYTTLLYTLPLGVCAFWRVARLVPWKALLGRLLFAAGLGLAVAAPWLWHSYVQSGNPFFPFLGSLFPSPLWPTGLGLTNITLYHFPTEWRQAILFPVTMTYLSNRFMEGADGSFGLVLVVFTLLFVPFFLRGKWPERAVIVCAVLGTAFLWRTTTYGRYWLPALWLIGMTGATSLPSFLRTRSALYAASAAILVLAMFHVPITMIGLWFDPKGWGWDVYSKGISRVEYLERTYPGYKQLLALDVFKTGWPRVWVTGFDGAGHLDIEPLQALTWELATHAGNEPSSIMRYLALPGCKYWIVNRQSPDAANFLGTPVLSLYWTRKNMIFSNNALEVYQVPSQDEIFEALQFRSLPGSDLVVNGSFEEMRGDAPLGWKPADGSLLWIRDPQNDPNADRYVRAGIGKSWLQTITLPPGKADYELRQRTRAAGGPLAVHARMQVNWATVDGQSLGAKFEVIPAGSSWQQFQMQVTAPANAAYAQIFLTVQDGGDADFDDVQLLVIR